METEGNFYDFEIWNWEILEFEVYMICIPFDFICSLEFLTGWSEGDTMQNELEHISSCCHIFFRRSDCDATKMLWKTKAGIIKIILITKFIYS